MTRCPTCAAWLQTGLPHVCHIEDGPEWWAGEPITPKDWQLIALLNDPRAVARVVGYWQRKEHER